MEPGYPGLVLGKRRGCLSGLGQVPGAQGGFELLCLHCIAWCGWHIFPCHLQSNVMSLVYSGVTSKAGETHSRSQRFRAGLKVKCMQLYEKHRQGDSVPPKSHWQSNTMVWTHRVSKKAQKVYPYFTSATTHHQGGMLCVTLNNPPDTHETNHIPTQTAHVVQHHVVTECWGHAAHIYC
jgi:hypothetical protein